jgi:lysophospholipase L1-like esterase
MTEMRISVLFLPLLTVSLFAQQPAAPAPDVERMQRTLRDWANLGRYAADNAKVQSPKPGEERVVFMGDSITDAWGRKYQHFFAGKPYINRGISGQTTPQMLIRFRPDVLAHKPKAVVILAGTNDIAGNTGAMTLEQIQGNIQSMAELAKANGIKVILSSVLPICDYHRNQSERRPMDKIKALNTWLKGYAAGSGAIYLDYYSAHARRRRPAEERAHLRRPASQRRRLRADGAAGRRRYSIRLTVTFPSRE